MAAKGSAEQDRRVRTWLAEAIVIGAGLGVVFLAIFTIMIAADKDQTSRLVFTTVVPLFATWVGTVLAFYFAKDNFQAATDSVMRLRSP